MSKYGYYFDIDEEFFSAVNQELIEEGKSFIIAIISIIFIVFMIFTFIYMSNSYNTSTSNSNNNMNNNMNMNMLLNMLSKMDKKDLEKGLLEANKILNSKIH